MPEGNTQAQSAEQRVEKIKKARGVRTQEPGTSILIGEPFFHFVLCEPCRLCELCG